MATPESIKAKIQGLIDKSNETTGASDKDLTSAVGTLCKGYGSGGGTDDIFEQFIEGTLVEYSNNTLETVRDYLFYNLRTLKKVNLPKVKSIGNYAFNNCFELAITSLPSGVTSIGNSAFDCCYELAFTSLPSGVTSIGSYAFRACLKLALTSLPNGITSIGNYAFNQCREIALTRLPSGITSIGNMAFYDCKGLTNITFEGTPTSISASAFSNCTNLTTINVPWAEGEVANAPWGATNATINYNYTGE